MNYDNDEKIESCISWFTVEGSLDETSPDETSPPTIKLERIIKRCYGTQSILQNNNNNNPIIKIPSTYEKIFEFHQDEPNNPPSYFHEDTSFFTDYMCDKKIHWNCNIVPLGDKINRNDAVTEYEKQRKRWFEVNQSYMTAIDKLKKDISNNISGKITKRKQLKTEINTLNGRRMYLQGLETNNRPDPEDDDPDAVSDIIKEREEKQKKISELEEEINDLRERFTFVNDETSKHYDDAKKIIEDSEHNDDKLISINCITFDNYSEKYIILVDINGKVEFSNKGLVLKNYAPETFEFKKKIQNVKVNEDYIQPFKDYLNQERIKQKNYLIQEQIKEIYSYIKKNRPNIKLPKLPNFGIRTGVAEWLQTINNMGLSSMFSNINFDLNFLSGGNPRKTRKYSNYKKRRYSMKRSLRRKAFSYKKYS